MRVLLWGLTVACGAEAPQGADTDLDTDDGAAPACARPAGEVEVLAEGFARGTEGVAFSPDGTAYVSARDRLVAIDIDGQVEELALVPRASGVAWWRDAVWVTSSQDAEGADDPALVEVDALGAQTRHPLDGPSFPNFVVPTPWGTLLVDDPSLTGPGIWELDPDAGTTSLWSDAVPSPNGMVFSADGATLYVASTFIEEGLYAVAVADEVAGDAELLAAYPRGTAPDGLALAADGSVLVALNTGHRVERWVDGEGSSPLAEVFSPASLAFGTAGWDACDVVVTRLLGSEEVAVIGAGVAGAP